MSYSISELPPWSKIQHNVAYSPSTRPHQTRLAVTTHQQKQGDRTSDTDATIKTKGGRHSFMDTMTNIHLNFQVLIPRKSSLHSVHTASTKNGTVNSSPTNIIDSVHTAKTKYTTVNPSPMHRLSPYSKKNSIHRKTDCHRVPSGSAPPTRVWETAPKLGCRRKRYQASAGCPWRTPRSYPYRTVAMQTR